MKTQDFDYYLPAELIAQFPAEQRTSSRLLYLDSISNQQQDALFSNLPNYLRAGDVMVFNDTQVIKARIFGKKDSGGKVEVMVERVLDDRHVLAAIRASHAPKPDSRLLLADAIPVTVIARESEFYTLRFEHEKTVSELLECYGQLPLPPYIARSATAADEARYQTVYARNSGAVAAPTAGLHFDTGMMDRLRAMGVIIVYVTLHVGAGTFQPVRVENIADHTMHSETFHIPQATVDAIEQAKSTGGRILSVGTTSLRALEACASLHRGQLVAGYGDTQIFITPGYRFQVAERLLTNFHLPCSTLLMLVSAFSGMDNIQRAYQHAVAAQYRFFSYGDAMLIERSL
ncbi:MAG: tRNA preQ1(34) S-adenosylmethionine ribosyltransferase-isomerase QueA [Nitrosomonas sp.]|jgi:S-adenosylmethionine:tRNA ribosyltransferase-isomerase|uniref:tRNA preQ1(34) S-adenosylmethionine ribosyltransferase-isomerase QueA n=1 Tax=Nitrosomonas sp. TaxID=42353 RepID=UPI002734B04C|nr:tRNA preQ1(34) S-adenosylmethionine ribosyltransferase-isomerase QueA [Nitrosomonas sp.]MBK6958239.1 tRNA preQ1(34) S-adenosylmethionine ribosyltransferase-isomerase QueA [Nitrosomonas sp.]MDP3279809.1 tRNA preQ1(34) S-adenosylmethionine ribosyltransferase-isomerase QueA [Nitrosomonas sp.]MDP3662927.1 tRNA preQ1(34) S-adenosylmethionine ribosyltransferase-isomerase QueA [Nitrosomonas sp.]MDZ4105672.1 tRNA preQ1(34) S-adenosylmethionine ribosyltransferase-isomerase QueA [Nitrosomonas sp.]